MAEPYLGELIKLSGSLPALSAMADNLTPKHFFSGAALYIDGRIFLSLSPAGLALKLPRSDCLDLIAKGAKPLRYFPGAPIKKDYVVVPNGMIEGDALNGLVVQSIDFVQNQ